MSMRLRAEEHLRALVGRPDATLREDQWTAISALVEDKRRALVVQRTGWGKSAVYFVATLLLREAAIPPKPRRKTRPTFASQQKRLERKSQRSGVKSLRRSRPADD